MKQNIFPILLFFLVIFASGCLGQPEIPHNIPSQTTGTAQPANPLIVPTSSLSQIQPEPSGSNYPFSSDSCPQIITAPSESECPRNMSSVPEIVNISNPAHPSSDDYNSVPVNYPGNENLLLRYIALDDPCIRKFLGAGGSIMGITGQPHPLRKNESQASPPAVYAYRRINCTEVFVRFDIDLENRNISHINIEIR